MKLGLAPRIPSCFWRFGADSRDSRGVEISLVVQRMDTGQWWKVSKSRKTKTERKVWVAVTANGHSFVTCRRKSYTYIFYMHCWWHRMALCYSVNWKITLKWLNGIAMLFSQFSRPLIQHPVDWMAELHPVWIHRCLHSINT